MEPDINIEPLNPAPADVTILPINLKPNPDNGMDPMQYAFLMLYEFVQTGRVTAQIQAKGAMINIQQQNIMIGEEAKMTFKQLSWGALFTHKMVEKKEGKKKVKVLETVEKTDAGAVIEQQSTANEDVTAARAAMQSRINVLTQSNSIDNANLNNTTNITEQSVAAASKTEQELGTLTTQISRALS